MIDVSYTDLGEVCVTERIFAQVMSEYHKAEDQAVINGIKEWAKRSGEHVKILTIPEEKLKLILKLGFEEYERRLINDQT